MHSTSTAEQSSGFQGAVTGLTLPDLIQLKGLTRFSGCLVVHFGNLSGRIFFRDGEVIHAEQGELLGEQAFYRVATWPSGNFRTEPNVTTTCHTIHQSINYLLLEAHRIMDEEESAPPSSQQPPSHQSGIMSRLADVPGLEHGVVATTGGIPVGDASPEGEAVAAHGSYVALLANRLGNLCDLGDITAVAIHGENRHFLALQSKSHVFSAAISAEVKLETAEAAVRSALSRKNR